MNSICKRRAEVRESSSSSTLPARKTPPKKVQHYYCMAEVVKIGAYQNKVLPCIKEGQFIGNRLGSWPSLSEPLRIKVFTVESEYLCELLDSISNWLLEKRS